MAGIISKELLSEVLEIKIRDFEIKNSGLVYINLRYYKDIDTGIKHQSGCESSINIYELAYKGKEWARALGYTIWSNCTLTQVQNQYGSYVLEIKGIESNSIIEACQWILDNKDEE